MITAKTKMEKFFRNITFEIQKNGKFFSSYTLIINPEEYSQDEPSRSAITKTLGGAYIEEWGRGLISVNIKGTTGYKKKHYVSGEETDGFQAFKDLRNNVYRYFLEPDGKMKQKQEDEYELIFFNWEDDEHYIVYPERFLLMRSKNKPLLYSYDFSFICLYPTIYKQKPSPEILASLSVIEKFFLVSKNIVGVLANNY